MAKYFLDNIIKRYLIRRELDGKLLGTASRQLPSGTPNWKSWSWSYRGSKQYRAPSFAIEMAKRLAEIRNKYNLDWGVISIVEETWEITNIESLGVEYTY